MFRKVLLVGFFAAIICAFAETPPERLVDRLVHKKRKGEKITEVEREQCLEAFQKYHEKLTEKHGTRRNYKFREPDRAEYYVRAVKMAIIFPRKHGGWPFRSRVRFSALPKLKELYEEREDPFLLFASIFPLVTINQTEEAAQAYQTLRKSDPFLAKMVSQWYTRPGRNPAWLMAHHLKHEEQRKALEVADVAISVARASDSGLRDIAQVLEKMGEYERAETSYKKYGERRIDPWFIVGFYSRHQDETGEHGPTLRKGFSKLKERYFPDGMRRVRVKDFDSPPRSGVLFAKTTPTLEQKGFQDDSVIVAVDGYQVDNPRQYMFVRAMAPDKRRLTLIFWDGEQYRQLTGKVDQRRRFGTGQMKTYRPEGKQQ